MASTLKYLGQVLLVWQARTSIFGQVLLVWQARTSIFQ
jgi:hypothetical protein